ncbi:unnamed protein product [Gulo gulo]|uniref:Uncharacterized protein n=1 Tax=Gulo gulo TaxID=48420 RepID=A0A9X9LYP4_GULGU|nr:unnamed protein product [Gulo gulo]
MVWIIWLAAGYRSCLMSRCCWVGSGLAQKSGKEKVPVNTGEAQAERTPVEHLG